MEFHAPTGRFTWSKETPELVSHQLRALLKAIREYHGLPLTPYKHQGPLSGPEFLQARVTDIARRLDIDLGGYFGHEIDLSDLSDD